MKMTMASTDFYSIRLLMHKSAVVEEQNHSYDEAIENCCTRFYTAMSVFHMCGYDNRMSWILLQQFGDFILGNIG